MHSKINAYFSCITNYICYNINTDSIENKLRTNFDGLENNELWTQVRNDRLANNDHLEIELGYGEQAL